jgi:hypothetical protein
MQSFGITVHCNYTTALARLEYHLRVTAATDGPIEIEPVSGGTH